MMRKLSAIVALLGVMGLGGCEPPPCRQPFGDAFASREFDGRAMEDPPDGWTSGTLPFETCRKLCPGLQLGSSAYPTACRGRPTPEAHPEIAAVTCQYFVQYECH